ncbi:MIP family Ig-specific serine endopeptidase [Mycoplasma nasistruthionis]|uniref:DUF31 domain-containing protein n=1 Tax=Mycoplasma nasistruthionis TaxID=353852 RepID=A0A5B7XV21_9MOLU|nr:hypothetical protein [Mycoplasma nasistruthionis]QCZ36738.1 hypothetical protein FG904_01795 [Mycoplasma nasistruthionis]
MKLNKLLLLSLLSSPMALAASCQFGHSENISIKPSERPRDTGGSDKKKSDPSDPSSREGEKVDTDAPQKDPIQKHGLEPSNANSPEYINGSILDKYNADESAYIQGLYRYMFGGNEAEYQKDLNKAVNPSANVQEFNNLANQINQPEYKDAFLKNFSVINGDKKLVLNPVGFTLRQQHWADPTGDTGTARYVPNEIYKKALLQSFSIKITTENKNLKDSKYAEGRLDQGTAWILDYAIKDGEQYPTKWYIATNLHVIEKFTKLPEQAAKDNAVYSNIITQEEMKKRADEVFKTGEALDAEYQPTFDLNTKAREIAAKYGEKSPEFQEALQKAEAQGQKWEKAKKAHDQALEDITGLTKDIQLIHYNGETQVGAELDETDKVKSADIFRFDPSQVKIVYAGVNFLNSSPKDYLASDSPYKELEEMADIAILEFDFSNSTNKYVYERPNTTTNGVIRETIDNVYDYARYATADFANPESGLTSKPAPYDLYSKFDELNSQTLLADGKKVPLMRYNFIAVGFPVAYTDNFLRESKYQYDEGKKKL